MKFKDLADRFSSLESTTKRLEMTDILAELLGEATEKEIDKLIYLLQGQVSPAFKGLDIGLGEKYVEEAISISTGYSEKEVEERFTDTGDLGKTAAELVSKRTQKSLSQKELTVEDVYDSFLKIAKASGEGSEDRKIKILVEMLNSSDPKEAKYIVRIPLDKLRLGIGDPTVMDALSVMKEGDKSLREPLERGYNLCSDLGKVARLFVTEGIDTVKDIEVQVFNPIRPTLAERLKSAEEIIEKQEETAVEGKYDGFRLQCHKKGNEVKLFSRRLDDMTHMFPEVVEAIQDIDIEKVIFEGEALSYNEEAEQFQSFQETMQRRRKYGVEEMSEKYPLKLFVFDLMYLEGEDYTEKPYRERREALEEHFRRGGTLRRSEVEYTSDPKRVKELFEEKVSRGLEGIIAKDPEEPYEAGSRGWQWIKLKRSYKGKLTDTVDLVIIGYYKGKGSRTQFGFGGLLGAVYDKEKDEFKSITRVGTGFTEEQMKRFADKLGEIEVDTKPARVDSGVEPDHWVEPRYVVEINADEITKSPEHTAGKEKKEKGYALRFPRLEGWIRKEKKPEDATSIEEIIKIYDSQEKTKVEE